MRSSKLAHIPRRSNPLILPSNPANGLRHSAWGDLTVGQRMTTATELPSCERFALRLVALPSQDNSALVPLDESIRQTKL